MSGTKDDQAAQSQNLVMDAVLMFPKDAEKLREEFVEVPQGIDEELIEAKEGPASRKKYHGKRLKEVYGADPAVSAFVYKLSKMTSVDRSRATRQVIHLLNQLGFDEQPELPLMAPQSVTPDQGAVFDQSTSGERQETERKDDPAKARKRTKKAPEATAAPSEGMPLDEAQAAFERNVDKAPQPVAEDDDPRPRFLREKVKPTGLGPDAIH